MFSIKQRLNFPYFPSTFAEWHKTHVGGPRKCAWWKMGNSVEEKQNRPRMGERLYGNARGAIPGGTGNMWGRTVDTISRRSSIHLESNRDRHNQYQPNPGHVTKNSEPTSFDAHGV